MKVLVVTPSLDGLGGVANYYRAVLPHLKSVRCVDIEPMEIGSKHRTGPLIHPILDQFRFYLALKNKRPSLVHINPTLNIKCYFRDGLMIKIAKSMNIPVIVFFRGWNSAMEMFIERRSKSFFNQSYMRADHFIVLSSRFKNKLQSWGIKAPIQVLTTAVDDALLSNFSIDQKIFRIQHSQETKILFLSRVEKAKGIFETIEAVRILLAHGHRVSLTIAGVGSASHDVRRYLKQCPALRDQTDILGYVRDAQKRRVLHNNDILSLPTSHHEGLPAAVLEAMACGMTVLTRPVGGITDFFEHGKMGLILQENTPKVIAQGLRELIQDKRGRMAIARRNHHYALNHFLASKSARDLTATYRQLLHPDATLRR